VISGIGSTLRCYQGYECVLSVMNKSLVANGDSKRGEAIRHSWIDNDGIPLLVRPLLDCVVLALATVSKSALLRTEVDEDLNSELKEGVPTYSKEGILAFHRRSQPSLRSAIMEYSVGVGGIYEMGGKDYNGITDGEQEFAYIEVPDALQAYMRWLSIANLVQLLIAEIVSTKALIGGKEKYDEAEEGGYMNQRKESHKGKDVSSDDFILKYPSNDLILNGWKVGLLLKELIGVIASFGAPYSKSLAEGSIGKVLEKWSAFLGATVYTVSICRPDLIAPVDADASPHASPYASSQPAASPHASPQPDASPHVLHSDSEDGLCVHMSNLGLDIFFQGGGQESIRKDGDDIELINSSSSSSNSSSKRDFHEKEVEEEVWGGVRATVTRWVHEFNEANVDSVMDVPSASLKNENIATKEFWYDIETFKSHVRVSEHDHVNPGMNEDMQRERNSDMIDDQTFNDVVTEAKVESELKKKHRIELMLLCRGALGRRYPFVTRPQLFTLPTSYTLLHSQLTTLSNYSFPALCLICGAVMDANGKGKIHLYIYKYIYVK
jgi:hypothetical protein